MELETGFLPLEAYRAMPRDTETWLVEPIVNKGGQINIFGMPKRARKSYLALGLAWAVASGQEQWLGFDVKAHGPVLYLQLDTADSIWSQRVFDVHDGGFDLSNVWFASTKTMPYPFDLSEHEDILQETIEKVPGNPVMIVYDTGRSMHLGDENSSQDMTLFIQAIERVSGDMAKILITHDRKGSTEDVQENVEQESADLMRGNRGSNAVSGAMDTVIKMSPNGYMYYQGRACGEAHKKLKFTHVYGEMGYMWEEDIDLAGEARWLLKKHQSATERQLARMLASAQGINEERARSIIRREKEKL